MKQKFFRRKDDGEMSGKEKPSSSDVNINKQSYDNSFDTALLKSYTEQISDISKKAYSLYMRKQHIKRNMDSLKERLSKDEISENYFYEQSRYFLKGYDEYKAYSMYDEYISYLVRKMRSLSESIFSYIDSHEYDIPIVEKTDEEKKFEKEYNKKLSKSEKEKAKKDEEKGWVSSADEFSEQKKKVQTSLMDRMAKRVYASLFPNSSKGKIFANQLKNTQPSESRFGAFWNWFTGKSQESAFSSLAGKKKKKKSLIDRFVSQKKDDEEAFGDKTAFSKKFKSVRRMHFEGENELKNKNIRAQKNARDFVNKLMQKNEKTDIEYKATSYAALSNIMVKDFSLEVINAFPNFFKNLHKNLRLANMNVLSNTYTNMMIFSSLLAGVVVAIISGFFSIGALVPLPMVLANTFLGGILGVFLTFLGFNFYPKYKLKERNRDIDTNLPFALDHMSAVTSAGVTPLVMFSLISESKDYGQVSVELSKIVEYVHLFGYDLTTAVDKVAVTSPSKQLREFLEGFISSVESGGELKDFLRESADQAMLHYKLERQKYTESISTFSDIYTGLMVASPLFFVAALSMVSILGGTIGGMAVNTLMVLGTYLVIPSLNIIFIIFMEITQPNI